ncbi:sigma 54-interacting transcriptional regulator [Bythopirellula polymerisocia]|uniref:Nitrogen fixation protein VnfA n=1 Tax=Bythopirellula polymerisocia TaxID=2528003 RepID=A0A5C6D3E4_9BACT|nr:sigma 54-interacting transcriptional regulator [Bythopirellula polymerisocia]TWU29746.1 Nitrogen fixation protein VnfA [Bythopirellula polymerisocia]
MQPFDSYEKFLDLQRYVSWGDDDQQRISAVRERLLARSTVIIEDFYAEIRRHPFAAKVITGGEPQVAQLKSTLRQWLRQLLTGPYDRDYLALRSRVGQKHVSIGLDQVYTSTALSRMRNGLIRLLTEDWQETPDELYLTIESLNKLLDLDQAIIEDSYQTAFITQSQNLSKENLQLRVALEREQRSTHIIGACEPMMAVYRLIERTAATDKPILIQGESGTGKELVAKALHRASRFAGKPLVVINCAALPENLLESELFGHEKGAFTGAIASKPGLFEVADGGTLFIDEIGELAGGLQAKLLRVLEDGSLRRVGSVKERRVNVRLLAATNRDLGKEIEKGRFREDLYYRINVLTILLPPLRERRGDIPQLARHFAGKGWNWESRFMQILENYSWPGNVRQLRNAIERAKVLAEENTLIAENLPPEIWRSGNEKDILTPSSEADLETVNRAHIADTFRRHSGNKARTARALGISRRTLYRLLEKHDIEEDAAQ